MELAGRLLSTVQRRLHRGWAREPFKLTETWPFAVGAYTMDDVARDVTLLPPQFVAHGVEANGGIFNRPFSEGFTHADVDAAAAETRGGLHTEDDARDGRAHGAPARRDAGRCHARTSRHLLDLFFGTSFTPAASVSTRPTP